MGMFSKRKKRSTAFYVDDPQKTLHKNLEFTASEQYRLLRTNVNFTIPPDIKCPILGVTSSIRGEDKSTTAVNLSYVMAEKGHRVLLIDGDLRLPSVAKKLSNVNVSDCVMNESGGGAGYAKNTVNTRSIKNISTAIRHMKAVTVINRD